MSASRRAYGSGRIYKKHGAWYGTWRPTPNAKRLNRKIGPVRKAHTNEGLTRAMAERRFRQMMEEISASPLVERARFEDVAERHVNRLEVLGRKPSTIEDYRSICRNHLNPAFGRLPIASIKRADVERFQMNLLRSGLARKTVRNVMANLHGVFEFARTQEMLSANPAALVERPKVPNVNPNFRYLTLAEVDRVLAEVPSGDVLGPMERVLYLTAVLSGLRQGELLALRWRDVDWDARRIRVRESFSRGKLGTPKSESSSRSVPLSEALARELEMHSRVSRFSQGTDRVFCHPVTGHIFDRSKCRTRFIAARDAAKVTPVTFHELRHTYGTAMAAAGTPMRTLMEWMGHRDIQTTMKYAHFSPGEQDAELVARAFAGLKLDLESDPHAARASLEDHPNSDQIAPPTR